jgi:predicted acyl esterase
VSQATRQSFPIVLVYTSAPVPTLLEVTGPIVVRLFAASSATDTDFTAKLVDVRPDGYAQKLADGILRMRYRTSRLCPTLLTPDQVYELWESAPPPLPSGEGGESSAECFRRPG